MNYKGGTQKEVWLQIFLEIRKLISIFVEKSEKYIYALKIKLERLGNLSFFNV